MKPNTNDTQKLFATVKNETGAYKHLNGQTFEIGQLHKSGGAALLVPKPLLGYVLIDFPAKNVEIH